MSPNVIAPLQTPKFRQLLQQCIHCGLCLQACPTYVTLGTEMDAPRGRIALMRAASDGRIGIEGAFQKHMNLCLACRSCVSACPSGVRYGALIDIARLAVQTNRAPSLYERALRWLTLKALMPHTDRLKSIARLIYFYQRSGFQKLIRSLNLLPGRIRTIEALLPPLPRSYPDYRQPAPALGAHKGTVAFFHGCVQEAFLAETNAATVRVLQRNGFEVHTPVTQTCCGASHHHIGEGNLARQLARQNIDAFLKLDQAVNLDAIINNAGGCGAMLKEYDQLLRNDELYAEKAKTFVAKVEDISEFLDGRLSAAPEGQINRRVVFADSCHLRHAQKVIEQPRDLLRAIPGLELVELEHPEHCCGSAGIYNIVQASTAQAILDHKMADILASGADTIVVSNPGCYFQLFSAVRSKNENPKSKLPIQVVHLVELLDESYQVSGK